MELRKHLRSMCLNISKTIQRGIKQNDHTKALFVVGHQRSGTSMMVETLKKHIDVDVYGGVSKAMRNFRLKDNEKIGQILRHSRAVVAVFKPLEDSDRIVDLLNAFHDSKAIWMFRGYHDVINSSLKKGWGTQLYEYVTNIHDGVHFDYSEPLNLTKENVEVLNNLYYKDISEEDCAAIIWFLRNTIYFDKKLYENERVLLLNYESLVEYPETEMGRILAFLGLKIIRIHGHIHSSSINKDRPKKLHPKIEIKCNEMYLNLLNGLNR